MLLWELFCGNDNPSTGPRVLRSDLPRKPVVAVESLVCVLPSLAVSVHFAAPPRSASDRDLGERLSPRCLPARRSFVVCRMKALL